MSVWFCQSRSSHLALSFCTNLELQDYLESDYDGAARERPWRRAGAPLNDRALMSWNSAADRRYHLRLDGAMPSSVENRTVACLLAASFEGLVCTQASRHFFIHLGEDDFLFGRDLARRKNPSCIPVGKRCVRTTHSERNDR